MVADCLGSLTAEAGTAAGVEAVGVDTGLRIGSAWGVSVACSSFRLFHT